MAATTMGEAAELQAAQRLISEQQQIASALRDLIAAVASGADAAAILTGVLKSIAASACSGAAGVSSALRCE